MFNNRTHHRNRRVSATLAALTIGATLTLAACGKDSSTAQTTAAPAESAAANSAIPTTTEASVPQSSTSESSSSVGSPSSAPTSSAENSAAAACTPYLAISDELNQQQPDPAKLGPLFDAFKAAVPAELADSAKVMSDAAQKMTASQGQDTSAMEGPAFAQAQTAVSTWMFGHCSFDAKISVTTKDFEFDGLSSTMKPGKTAFLVTNDGPESHEMVIGTKNAGTTESWQDLLKLPEETAMTKVTMLGGVQVPAVGSVALLVVDLKPGDYAALCFVSMGTSVGSDGSVTQGTGVPHAMSGMVKEFTVAP